MKNGLFNILPKIGCSPRLLNNIKFDGPTSDAFNIRSGVKQSCVLAPTLFGIFVILLKDAYGTAKEGTYLRTRSDGKLFNHSRLKAKTKVQVKCP